MKRAHLSKTGLTRSLNGTLGSWRFCSQAKFKIYKPTVRYSSNFANPSGPANKVEIRAVLQQYSVYAKTHRTIVFHVGSKPKYVPKIFAYGIPVALSAWIFTLFKEDNEDEANKQLQENFQLPSIDLTNFLLYSIVALPLCIGYTAFRNENFVVRFINDARAHPKMSFATEAVIKKILRTKHFIGSLLPIGLMYAGAAAMMLASSDYDKTIKRELGSYSTVSSTAIVRNMSVLTGFGMVILSLVFYQPFIGVLPLVVATAAPFISGKDKKDNQS